MRAVRGRRSVGSPGSGTVGDGPGVGLLPGFGASRVPLIVGNEVDRRIANAVEEETQGRVNIDLTTARST